MKTNNRIKERIKMNTVTEYCYCKNITTIIVVTLQY